MLISSNTKKSSLPDYDSLSFTPICEVSPLQAWGILSDESVDSVLVDVRTEPEWIFSGIADLRELGKDVVKLSWKLYPSYAHNDAFADQLKGFLGDRQPYLLFMCRTGGRSGEAANFMAKHGYSHCINILGGFEGPLSASGHRGEVAGWRYDALPWVQG